MELSDNERRFIQEYYVLGKSYGEIVEKIEIKADAQSIDEVRKLYQSTKEHDLVKEIERLKSQYSGIKTRVKKANEKKDSKQFSNLSHWDEFKDFCKEDSWVTIETHVGDEKGKFGRILANIWLEETNVNQWLIDNKYAVAYFGQSKDDIEKAHLTNRKILQERNEVE